MVAGFAPCYEQVLTALALVEDGVVSKAAECGLKDALRDVADAVRVAQPEVVRTSLSSVYTCCSCRYTLYSGSPGRTTKHNLAQD